MRYLYLAIRPLPTSEDIPALEAALAKALPHPANRAYVEGLGGTPAIRASRLGALSLLPRLLEFHRSSGGSIPAAHTLCLGRDGYGRPFIQSEGATGVNPIDFNLSHSTGHAACALLIGGGKVGLDVEEPLEPARAKRLIARYATPGERSFLSLQDEPDDLQAAQAFVRLWTAREALSKQAGGGMPLRYDASQVPDELTLLRGTLPRTETAVALCFPTGNDGLTPTLDQDIQLIWDI